MARKLKITTPYGATYFIHENGEIERGDMPGNPSGQWTFLGLQHVKRNDFIPFHVLAALTATELSVLPEFLYKNGHPQWTVRDNDHGTTRTWGNTHHHGVKSIEVAS